MQRSPEGRRFFPSAREMRVWSEYSRDYESKVFSITSFAKRRRALLQRVLPGIVIEMGCGPLGLMLNDIADLPGTRAIGSDFCWDMVKQSRQRTRERNVRYLLTDNRQPALGEATVDTIVSINSFLPERRAEVLMIFQEVALALRKGGRLVAMLPSFEMSLIARDNWRMDINLDLTNHREWDTSGWQCFYTVADIGSLMRGCRFGDYRIETVAFDAPEEIDHIQRVYGDRLENVPRQRLVDSPLFEHLLIAER